MTERNEQLLKRIGSAWSGHLPLWAIAITVWCVNSTILLGFALSPHHFLAALFANSVAAVALLGTAFTWRAYVHRFTNSSPIPWWLVCAAGAVVGLIKGLVTYLVFWTLTETPFTMSAVIQATIPAAVIGLWLLPAFGIIGSILADYNWEREQLIRTIVARELSSAPTRYLDDEVTQFITKAKNQIEAVGDSPENFQTLLTELAEREVRPMSHKLWQYESARIDSFNFRDLARSAIRQHRFSPVWTSISLVVSLFFLQAPLVGALEASWRSVFQAAITAAILALGRAIPLYGPLSGPLVFFLTPAVAIIVIELVTVSTLGPLPGVTSFVADLTLYSALIMTVLILGAVFSARDNHNEVIARLSHIRRVDSAPDADRIIQLLRRRETAEYLHGYVQNQLLAHAVKLSTAPHSLTEVRGHITRLFEDLEQGALNTNTPPTLTLEDVTNNLREVWRGVMDVRLNCPSDETLSPLEVALIDRLSTEFAANARRHGEATHIDIDVTCTTDILTLTARDNGVGLSPGPDGLGTALVESLSQGRWLRSADSEGSGTIVSCVISRLKDTMI